MRGRSKWYIGGACFLLSLFFIFPVLAYWVISSFVLPPTRLKSLLITEMAKYVKGEFDCHSVELTYWETWPLAGIAMIEHYEIGINDLYISEEKNRIVVELIEIDPVHVHRFLGQIADMPEIQLKKADLPVLH